MEDKKIHISRIQISDLAGSDKTIDHTLDPDVNVFFGQNGSGKTSLLKILHAALQNSTQNLSTVPFTTAKVSINFFGLFLLMREITNQPSYDKEQPNSTPLLYNMLATPATEAKQILKWQSSIFHRTQNNQWLPIPDDTAEYMVDHNYLPTSRLYLGLEHQPSWSTTSKLTEQELEENFGKLITDLWKEYNFDLSNLKANIQQEGLANIMKDIWSPPDRMTETQPDLRGTYDRVNQFFQRQKIEHIVTSFEDFTSLIDKQPHLMSVIEDINNVELSIEKAMIPRTKLLHLIKELYGQKLTLNFDEKQISLKTTNDREISLGSLSSGQKHLLMILLSTLLFRARPIIIDEPEISMHVLWQSQLINSMRQLSPSSQIIIATHSPEIVSSIDNDKLFRL